MNITSFFLLQFLVCIDLLVFRFFVQLEFKNKNPLFGDDHIEILLPMALVKM